MIPLDDVEKDKIIDKVLLNLEQEKVVILNENARKTTVLDKK